MVGLGLLIFRAGKGAIVEGVCIVVRPVVDQLPIAHLALAMGIEEREERPWE